MTHQYLALYRDDGPEQRAQTALVTSIGGGWLALVYLDDQVLMRKVSVDDNPHLIPFKEQPASIDTAREQFRGIASRLGFDPSVQPYIGEIDSGNRRADFLKLQASDDETSGGSPASEPGDAEELAGTGPGPGVCPGGDGDSLPPAGRGHLGEGEHVHEGLCFEDLIGGDDEPSNEGDIFS